MEKKIWLNTLDQKIATGLVVPIVATALSVRVDDRDEPHDHHENPAPLVATTVNEWGASGTNVSAHVTGFSANAFQLWTRGEAVWQVSTRPDLLLTIGSPRAGAPIIVPMQRRF